MKVLVPLLGLLLAGSQPEPYAGPEDAFSVSGWNVVCRADQPARYSMCEADDRLLQTRISLLVDRSGVHWWIGPDCSKSVTVLKDKIWLAEGKTTNLAELERDIVKGMRAANRMAGRKCSAPSLTADTLKSAVKIAKLLTSF